MHRIALLKIKIVFVSVLVGFQRCPKVLKEPADCIDLVDVARAPLNLCVTIAAEGQILKGAETLELFRFYQRAWRGQEEFYLRQAHGY